MTSVHALAQYHLAYDNDKFATATGAIAAALNPQDPAYTRLSNLLTDTALEICGHPAYHGVGWTLARELYALGITDTSAIDAYLEIYRTQAAQFRVLLEDDPATHAAFLIEVAQLITEDTARHASTLAHWQGRTVYHLLSACAGYLKTATVILRYGAEAGQAHFHYAAEKFARAMRDTRYGLDEALQQRELPPFFAHLRDVLRKMEEG